MIPTRYARILIYQVYRKTLSKKARKFNNKNQQTMSKAKTTAVHTSANAPFKIWEHDGVFTIVLGNAIMENQDFKTKAEAEKFIAKKPYTLLINAACYCMEQQLKLKNNEKETEKVA